MKMPGPLILQVDRLEDRTCPSPFGPDSILAATAPTDRESIDANDTVEVVPWGTESSGDPYDWIMMVMSPEQMMTLANEYDQSSDAAAMLSPSKPGAPAEVRMKGQAGMTDSTAGSMSEAAEMPPAQMVMDQPPLVRRSLSPSKTPEMSEMTDSEAGQTDPETDPDMNATMPEETGEAPSADRPPMLSPGEILPRIELPLRSAPIEPELESAQPSERIEPVDRMDWPILDGFHGSSIATMRDFRSGLSSNSLTLPEGQSTRTFVNRPDRTAACTSASLAD